MNESSVWQAVHRIEEAERKISMASQQAEDAAKRIAHMLENGYGGNGLRLIELLETPISIVNNTTVNNH